jgi:hypothetical protein
MRSQRTYGVLIMRLCPKATAAKTRETKTGFIVDAKKTRTSLERGKDVAIGGRFIFMFVIIYPSLANLGSADRRWSDRSYVLPIFT